LAETIHFETACN